MTRTIPALSALAVTFSLLVFALLQRNAPLAPATSGVCSAAPVAATIAPVAPASVEVTSCGDETVLASTESR